MFQGAYLYACPMDFGKEGEYILPKTEPILVPLHPPGPADAAEKLRFLNKICDEFDIMRMIANLDDESKKRILIWLQIILEKEDNGRNDQSK